MDEAESIIDGFAASKSFHAVFTPNAEIVQLCIEDENVRGIVNSADLIVPDGAGVVLASKILKKPLKGKVAGVDLGRRAIALSEKKGYGVYFLGGKPGIAELAADKLREKYPGFKLVGTHDGYFKKEGEESDRVINDIAALSPDILFVCFGVPAQEKWIMANRDKLSGIGLIMGLGGSLDSYAGTVKRAPDIFIKLNLEWFYRLIKEPKRIGRMMKLPKFVFGTIFAKITGKA
ncbi:MAG: WecB/TagA/CpsF family glycosyltransferase [Clostridia bacterium]|nr:WecB/TagA/CpsF family glycosyltransferase [Clostridia bacterium]